MRNGRSRSPVLVGLWSLLGSFFVYGAHVACGGRAIPHGVVSVPAQTASAPSASSSAVVPMTTATANVATECGCTPPKTSASFVVTGDEKIQLDPSDSSAELELAYTRGPAGKKLVTLQAVVRAYRVDLPSERPTTLALRVTLPEGGSQPSTAKDLEAYVTTWGGGSTTGGLQIAPRAYATLTKSALTYSITADSLEIKGSLTLKDVPTGKSITLEKLSVRKVGTALLPARTGSFRAP